MRQLPNLPRDFLYAMCKHNDSLVSYMAQLIDELQDENDQLRYRLEPFAAVEPFAEAMMNAARDAPH